MQAGRSWPKPLWGLSMQRAGALPVLVAAGARRLAEAAAGARSPGALAGLGGVWLRLGRRWADRSARATRWGLPGPARWHLVLAHRRCAAA